MDAMLYETFLRKAFGVERGEDPAHIADADVATLASSGHSEWLNAMKIGIAYAMLCYKSRYTEKKKLKDPEDHDKLNDYINRVLDAQSSKEAFDIIGRYRDYEKELNTRESRF